MALIVEDGTGKEDAEAYQTVAEADAYHLKRGNTEWAALTTEEKEAALRKASDYMLQTYRQRWDGLRTVVIQALDWPRAYVRRDDALDSYLYTDVIVGSESALYPFDFIPREVKAAEAELALRSITEDLTLETERLTTGEAVGSIRVTYDRGAADKRRFPMVEGLLRPFFKAGGAATLVRG